MKRSARGPTVKTSDQDRTFHRSEHQTPIGLLPSCSTVILQKKLFLHKNHISKKATHEQRLTRVQMPSARARDRHKTKTPIRGAHRARKKCESTFITLSFFARYRSTPPKIGMLISYERWSERIRDPFGSILRWR